MKHQEHFSQRMPRREFLRMLGAAGVSAACLPRLWAAGAPGRRPPNIVLIFTDDQGYYDLGCQGHPKIKTPNIDRLAKEGTRFTDFYVAASICIPSRFALMTGGYPERNGLRSAPMLPALLQGAGYATGLVGKWHLGSEPKSVPTARGFDEFFGTLVSNNDTTTLWRGTQVFQDPYDNSQLTQTLTREALDFIDRHREKPFFLYLAHNAPHHPIPVSKEFQGKSAFGRPYGDAVEEIDWSVGQVLERLDQHGLTENTLVIYTSDNGPRSGDGGAATPYRGFKWSYLDGGQRVPCLMRWPGHVKAGRVCDALASTLDFLPTFVGLAGGKLEANRVHDGHDAWPLFSGATEQSPWSAFYYHGSSGNGAKAIRSGRWKYFVQPDGKKSGKGAGYVIPAGGLFDLKAVPDETENVAAEHPEVAARFQELVGEYSDALKERRAIRVPAKAFE
jgi:arylsulfatase A